MNLLFVHGRSQQGKDPQSLKELWLSTLQEGLSQLEVEIPGRVTVDMPFYGDELESLRREFISHRERGEDGAPQDVKFALFQRKLVEEIAAEAGVNTDSSADQTRERGPANWEWVQSILKALDKRFPGISDGTLSRFTEDVYLYLTVPKIRTHIDEIVASAVGDQDTVIIAHSLGTVVSYNVLTKASALNGRLAKFITLGSPLGLRSITSKLDQPLKYPDPTASWYNAYDEADVVALNPLDRNHFPVDGEIQNNNTVKNQTRNRHGIVGYLNDRNVAHEISMAAGLI